MGSSASKGARTAGSAVRKYPTRPSGATTQPSVTSTSPAASGPTVHPTAPPAQTKTETIIKDVQDPAFASRLSSLGAVQPNPHYSPTSTSRFDPQRREDSSQSLPDMMQTPPQSAFPDPRNNPVLRVLEARQRIADEAEDEMRNVGRRGFAGRKYIDAATIQLVLMRQAKGEPNSRIEAALGIQQGRLRRLKKGIVATVGLE